MGRARVLVLIASSMVLTGGVSHATQVVGHGVADAVRGEGMQGALAGGVTAAQAGDFDVEVVDNAFEPREFGAQAGQDGTAAVTWMQTGSNPHTVTADDGSFDSHPDCPPNFAGCMGEGDTYESDPLPPGTYSYYCKIHGGPGGEGMAGVLVVSESPAAPTTTAPPGAGQAGGDARQEMPQTAGTGDDAPTPAPMQESESSAPATELPATGFPALVGLAGTLLVAMAWLAGRLHG